MALNPRRRQDPEGRYEERVDGITLEDAATFVASATPVIGDAMAAKEVYDELQKDDPNYYLAGALGGAAVIGLVPGLGDAAANAIRAGARKAIDVGKRIEVDPNTVGSLGGNIKLKPPVEEATPQVSNIDYQKKMAEFDATETADDWQTTVGNYVTESRDVNPTVRTPDLEASAKDLLDGKITREQHLENIDKYKPVEAWDALPREPSSKATVFSLKPDQREKGKFILPDKAVKNLNVEKSSLKVGDKFNGRLDIPAYNRFDTWIVAGTSSAEKGVTHYSKAIHYKGVDDKPVRFLASPKTSEKIGTGEAGKTGYATVSGEIKDLDVEEIRDKAAKFLEDPEWTQVGFDPRRQGGFYVRSGENKHVPIREADEVIQIGPLVLAKNAKLDMEYTGYNEGGVVDSMDKEMNDMLLEEQVDPVSGNTAPVGALPSEVRDDITVNVSPNEFVIPAYTLRYFGEDFFNELLGASEQGWDRIKAGEEPMPPKSESDTEALKDGYDEGGAIPDEGAAVPGEDVDVPPPVGGGYGQYGGTGATFGGFEFKIFINPETEQEIRIYFFNGKPLSRIPEGFREKGATAVEEQEEVAEEQTRDDDDKAVIAGVPEEEQTWRNTPVDDWTTKDYNAYNLDMRDSINKGKDPLSLGLIENGILSAVGGLIGGPVGALGLTTLAKKAKVKQAEEAHEKALSIFQSEDASAEDRANADITRYLTGSALNKSGYAVSVANPFSGFKDEDTILDRILGTEGDLDESGMLTQEALDARMLAQFGSADASYMTSDDPYAPPSRGLGEFLRDGKVYYDDTSSGILEKTAAITKTVEDENARVAAIEAEKARLEAEEAARKLKEAADLAEAIRLEQELKDKQAAAAKAAKAAEAAKAAADKKAKEEAARIAEDKRFKEELEKTDTATRTGSAAPTTSPRPPSKPTDPGYMKDPKGYSLIDTGRVNSEGQKQYRMPTAEEQATQRMAANTDNDDSGSDSSDSGDACCFIMLEARYGNGTMDKVVRKYRDEYMTDRNRRGYYKVAEVFVPLMRKSPTFKWVITKTFADPLVSYGKYHYNEKKVGVVFTPVKNFWMKLFDIVGGDTKFIRENGETV